MVLLIIIPIKWLFHWGYTPFSDIPIFSCVCGAKPCCIQTMCHPKASWMRKRWKSIPENSKRDLVAVLIAPICSLLEFSNPKYPIRKWLSNGISRQVRWSQSVDLTVPVALPKSATVHGAPDLHPSLLFPEAGALPRTFPQGVIARPTLSMYRGQPAFPMSGNVL